MISVDMLCMARRSRNHERDFIKRAQIAVIHITK